MSNYYQQTGFVSNSDLGSLQRVMRLQGPELTGVDKALRIGNLVDARFTEADRFYDLEAEEGEQALAERMYEAGLSDPTLRFFFERARMQHEVYRRAEKVEYDGYTITMPMRCKFDFYLRALSSGADLKTTACTSRQSFVDSIFWLGYDRAAAWYMDRGRLDTFWIVGIGKKEHRHSRKHPVFKYAIKRGDETYRAGLSKYRFLAYYYYYLIYNLKL